MNHWRWGVLMTVGLASPAGADAAVVKLREAAQSSGSLIRLGDVAAIGAADADVRHKLSRVSLAPAPAAGQTLPLGMAQIRRRLGRLGFNLADVSLVGASRVTVRPGKGPAEPIPDDAISPDLPAPLPGVDLKAEHVRRAVADYVATQLAKPREDIHLEMDTAAALRELSRLGRTDSLQVTSRPGSRCLGRCEVQIVTYHGGKADRRTTVPVVVGLYEHVVVAVRAVGRGGRLADDDVALERVCVTRAGGGFYRRVADVVGKQATRDLVAGKPVTLRDVKGLPMIRRGERVVLTVVGRGFRVRTEAVAKADGVQGSTIELCRLNSRETVTGRVVAPGQATIEMPPRVRAVAVTAAAAPEPQ